MRKNSSSRLWLLSYTVDLPYIRGRTTFLFCLTRIFKRDHGKIRAHSLLGQSGRLSWQSSTFSLYYTGKRRSQMMVACFEKVSQILYRMTNSHSLAWYASIIVTTAVEWDNKSVKQKSDSQRNEVLVTRQKDFPSTNGIIGLWWQVFWHILSSTPMCTCYTTTDTTNNTCHKSPTTLVRFPIAIDTLLWTTHTHTPTRSFTDKRSIDWFRVTLKMVIHRWRLGNSVNWRDQIRIIGSTI